jgi:hypothetical protein
LLPLAVTVILQVGIDARASTLTSLLAPKSSHLERLVAAPFVFELQQDIAIATDFPATATGQGFTYRFDPTLGGFRRNEQTLGPTLLERGHTIGAGRLDLGLSYLYASFTTINGEPLNSLTRPVLFQSVGLLDRGSIHFQQFDLRTHAFYISATYGLTQRWDFNVLFPLLFTTLSLQKTITNQAFGRSTEPPESGAVVGIGDVQIRSKYMISDGGWWSTAVLVSLRAPTGDVNNFQGLGDWTVRPGLAFSTDRVRFAPRFSTAANLSVDIDASDLARTRVLYGVSLSYRALSWITVNLELLGASQVADDLRSDFLPGISPGGFELGQFPDITVTPTPGGVQITQRIPRQDLVDIAPGLKCQYRQAVLFASVLVPLTADGVRAPAIPLVGLDLRF